MSAAVTLDDLIRPKTAQHDGVCGDCDQLIRVGQLIVLAGGAGWVLDECPEVKLRPVCGNCFMEIPLSGECPC
jgi:hypothetical protein